MPADVEIIMTDHGRGEVLTLDLVVDRISIEGVAEVKEPRNEG